MILWGRSVIYPIPYTLYPIPYTLYLVPYILYSIPYTIYHIPYTLYLLPYIHILYPIPYTLYPVSYTQPAASWLDDWLAQQTRQFLAACVGICKPLGAQSLASFGWCKLLGDWVVSSNDFCESWQPAFFLLVVEFRWRLGGFQQ